MLKRLLDLGHRPGKVVGLPVDELRRLASASAASMQPPRQPAPDAADELGGLLGQLAAHRFDEFRGRLSQLLLRKGLSSFVADVVAPMNEMVGEAWTRGRAADLRGAPVHRGGAGSAAQCDRLDPEQRRAAARSADDLSAGAARAGHPDGRGHLRPRRLPLLLARRADAGVGHHDGCRRAAGRHRRAVVFVGGQRQPGRSTASPNCAAGCHRRSKSGPAAAARQCAGVRRRACSRCARSMKSPRRCSAGGRKTPRPRETLQNPSGLSVDVLRRRH